ncbi:MAG: CPBP family intramembrane metalloprotease [Candidatus Diapherotrites archaeon]|nr:CPBP family intramembrane metalloprotease [Candidatus Diapherotrites archaeon]
MSNLYFGAAITLIRIFLLLPIFIPLLPRKITKPRTKDIGIGLLSGVFLFFFLKLFWRVSPPADPIIEVILITLLFAPIAEELLYRKIVFGYMIKTMRAGLSHETVLSLIYMGAILTLSELILSTDWLILILLLSAMLIVFPLVYLFKRLPPRAYPYSAWIWVIPLVILQAFIFVSLHGMNKNWPLVVSALVYGALYYRMKSIYPAIAAHFSYNLSFLLWLISIV